MNNYEPALAGSAEAQQHFLNNQVNLFLFDLKNEATEHGFKSTESWTIQLATDEELIGLKREHYPVISIRLQPDALLAVFHRVKSKLQQSLSTNDQSLTVNDLAGNEKRHLAAYRVMNARR